MRKLIDGYEENLKKWGFGVFATLTSAILIASGVQLINARELPSKIENNRIAIEQNRQSIKELQSQGQAQIRVLTEISTTVKIMEKQGDDKNTMLKELVGLSQKTREEQSSRTNDVKAIRPAIELLIKHVNNSSAHESSQ